MTQKKATKSTILLAKITQKTHAFLRPAIHNKLNGRRKNQEREGKYPL
jgi:hypothetical protein